jgi:signal transduction histidine kinase
LIDDGDARAALVEDLHEMEALIGMILESERLNQRHVSLNLTVLRLDDLVREVLEQFFSTREISAQMQSVEIQADRTRLELLIKNLLDNACKYSSDDGQPPEVRIFNDADHAVIEVQDWGCGMTAEQLARAREAFYRADSARQRSTGGFGLGLYLCDRIVRAHDGKMSLQSAPEEGTLVRVELPFSNASG